ncbi:MAG: hypothetical protein E8D46_04575 [Nitrospira sp.]|nr:MAG: hypothetical protein E8D46_04575 [Nitrospira sp.]
MKQLLLIMTMILWAASAQAATRYVDGGVAVSGNGLSWSTAWKTIADIAGLNPGDTVYFSGGSSGRTYSTPVDWQPPSGSAGGGPITYAVGQDKGHNGMVAFTRAGTSARMSFISLDTTRYITINGGVNGQRRMTVDKSFAYLFYTQNMADKHVRLLYVEWNGPAILSYGNYYEIAYCYGIAPLSEGASSSDGFIQYIGSGGSSSGYGLNSIHHNHFEVPHKKSAGEGFDLLKWVGSVDIYNNTFLSVYNPGYTGNQHNDGIQTGASFVRVYNNYFENFNSYPIFNQMFGDTAHWRIYNNVINAQESGVDWTAYHCMALGFPVTGKTVSDYIVANNTCIGGANRRGIHFNTGAVGTIGADVYLVNNLVYDSDTVVTWNGPGTPTVSNNVGGTSNLGFVNNALFPIADFRLTAAATSAIDQGIRPSYLTSVYTTDKTGGSRMLKPTWDIGAYTSDGQDQVTPSPPLNLFIK